MALRPRRNAGLTVRWMLKRWKNAREMHGTRPQLVDVLDDAARKRGLVITFVREPVSRSLSRFWYWRAKGSDSDKEGKARCATLAEYARTKMRANNQHEFMLGDAALGECPDTRQSRIGSVIMINNAFVAGRSAKLFSQRMCRQLRCPQTTQST